MPGSSALLERFYGADFFPREKKPMVEVRNGFFLPNIVLLYVPLPFGTMILVDANVPVSSVHAHVVPGAWNKAVGIVRAVKELLGEDVAAGKVHALIRARAGEWLRESWLFDVYRGKGMEEGRKSLAFGLILQDFSRTLADSDVDSVISGIVAGLHDEFGATLRV